MPNLSSYVGRRYRALVSDVLLDVGAQFHDRTGELMCVCDQPELRADDGDSALVIVPASDLDNPNMCRTVIGGGALPLAVECQCRECAALHAPVDHDAMHAHCRDESIGQ